MTDMPGFGILCCGKDIPALSHSVKCCTYITELMKKSGYQLCGYHTAQLQRKNTDMLRLCKEKLFHLCRTCDLVFTVGGDSFDADDMIPDITLELCDSEAVFFTLNLSGAANIGNYERNGGRKGSRTEYPPSRSRAGLCGKSLVLNLRCDEDFLRSVLPGLLPSISFAVTGLSGKDPEDSRITLEKLNDLCERRNASGYDFTEFTSKLSHK